MPDRVRKRKRMQGGRNEKVREEDVRRKNKSRGSEEEELNEYETNY